MIDINITIAIITAVTALFVAIISLIAAIINGRQAAQSTKELESIKYRFSRADTAETFSDGHLNASLDSLRIALQSIQLMKDEVQLILSAVETSLDTETALNRIRIAREQLFANYEQHLAELNDAEITAFHRAKNQALMIERFLHGNLTGKKFVSLLSPDQKTSLRELRNELTDIQYILRDKRSERLAQRTKPHGK